MNFLDLIEARNVYERGENVTQYLRGKFGVETSSSEIIEIAYDLQAGHYIDIVNSEWNLVNLYAQELAGILDKFIEHEETILDIGTGELTTLTFLLNHLKADLKNVLAFDVSWSRLAKGQAFLDANLKKENINVSAFVADIKEIPLHSNCIDVVISSHALEPNGHNLPELLTELFRVAKKKLVLFEPSYEMNSEEGKERMDRLGYIKGMASEVEKLGGKVLETIPIKNMSNPLNPTFCYIIEAPDSGTNRVMDDPVFCVPGTDFSLEYKNGFYGSKDTGLTYPVLQNIPVLKKQYGILATANF